MPNQQKPQTKKEAPKGKQQDAKSAQTKTGQKADTNKKR